MSAPTSAPSRRWLHLSPMNHRRLDNFRRNRRGYWSFWIFLALFVVSLGAEFVANDRPLIASYKGEILENWEATLPKFRKVMPVEYRRALAELAARRSNEVLLAAGE